MLEIDMIQQDCAGFFAIKAARRGPSITTLFYFTFKMALGNIRIYDACV